jgi:hypothetical protein
VRLGLCGSTAQVASSASIRSPKKAEGKKEEVRSSLRTFLIELQVIVPSSFHSRCFACKRLMKTEGGP